jgi:1,4-dihydroxy-2-naphthoate octaprenyltransferase
MQEILLTVITSAVVATVVGAAISAWLESRKSNWSTKLDALKTAVALEGYAITCADKLVDHSTAVSSEGHA